MLNKIAAILKDSSNIAIYSHINSDCDAMGSSLTLKCALEKLGKNVDVFSNSNFPTNFKFYGDLSYVNEKHCSSYDTVVCLDTPNENRLGKYKFTYRKNIKNVIVIDHHFLSNEKYGKINYVVESSSTCEIMFSLIKALGVRFDENMCKYLLSGILTDTGKFSHSVSSKTMEIVSKLISYGKIKMEEITNVLFNSMGQNMFEMLKKLYNNMEFFADNKFALVMFKKSDFVETNTSLDDTDAFPDLPLQFESVKFCILASEDDQGYFRVSLRSKGEISAKEVAETFGGGGHQNASGCKIFGAFEEVRQMLIDNTLSTLGWKND